MHAFTDDALGDDDAVALAARVRRGEMTAGELAAAALARAERITALQAVVTTGPTVTGRADGLLAGVPTYVKDNVDLAGLPTMNGADAWAPVPAKKNGDFARMFLATGLLPLGKTQLSEFGFSAVAEHPRLGPVRNPWDTSRPARASSSGTGALVAAGAVPLAHANDGGGSIRIPASVNGLVGLKPTRGRLAQDALLRKMPVRVVADGVQVTERVVAERVDSGHTRRLAAPGRL